jgi:hypothetical protein
MKLKIFSLVLIAILAISVISSVSAYNLHVEYPTEKNAPGTFGSYRWTGDEIHIAYGDRNVYAGGNSIAFNKGDAFTDILPATNLKLGTGNTICFIDSSSGLLNYLYIKNDLHADVNLRAWDRGVCRYPHFEGTYGNEIINNGDGHSVTIE